MSNDEEVTPDGSYTAACHSSDRTDTYRHYSADPPNTRSGDTIWNPRGYGRYPVRAAIRPPYP